MVYGLWSIVTPPHLPRVAERDPVLNSPTQRRYSNGRGRGIARREAQPIAVRVPRLRGTQTDNRTVLMFRFMKLVPPKGGTLTATDAPRFTHHVSQRGAVGTE